MVLKKLGRGLDSLIEETKSLGEKGEREPESPSTVDCGDITPNPFQPREAFDDGLIEELAESIREHGVIQPVVVRRRGEGYELVAGERRWRACLSVGLERIPVVVREVDDDRMLEIALVENIHREDLNPIEKARAYRRYLEELSYTHEEAAQRLGRDRSTITNQLRLLELPDDLQKLVSGGSLTMGHARALLGVVDDDQKREIAERIRTKGLSVRDAERLCRGDRAKRGSTRGGSSGSESSGGGSSGGGEKSAYFLDLERQIRERFATKARLEGGRERGKIVLEYYSMDELSRLLEMLLGD